MADESVGHPHDPLDEVGPVPDPAGTGDFVLPLFEFSLANDAVSELVSKGVLAFVTPQRIGPKLLPAVLDRSGRLSAELLPSVNGIARCEHHVPAPLAGGGATRSPRRCGVRFLVVTALGRAYPTAW